jgi:tRNA (guanine-N(7)-)-methyltransferase subunit TRM82
VILSIRTKTQQENASGSPKPHESPTKKRKLSIAHEDPPTIVDIVVTESQTHAVVVTGEDKCIRVFEISENGQLQSLSQRSARYIPQGYPF